MIGKIVTALALASALAQPAAAQDFNIFGAWSCSTTLYEQGLQPYGYQADLVISPDGNSYGNGAVYNPNLRNAVQPFKGPADGIVGPGQNGPWVRLRIHADGNHGILVFEGAPTGPASFYNRVQSQDPNTGASFVGEMQCTRNG